MAENFADRLAAAIRQKDSRVCVGLDPRLDLLPGLRAEEPLARVEEFCCAICEATAPYAACVKPQSAYFEALAPDGLACLWRVIRYARSLGLLVILDAKRNDIGSTAEAYAKACLGLHEGQTEPLADAVTVNAYLGSDGVQPFVDAAARYGTGLYVLVKTSNPSSGELQDLTLESGQMVYQHMADLVAYWGRDVVGASGYSSVGAVVGATYPEQLSELRRRVPTVPFLVPGYGHQGGTAQDVTRGCDKQGLGAVVNSSRGLIYAYKDSGLPFAEAAAQATMEMQAALNAAVNRG
jgi:orotidine-5'-phosphate decarboxylase